MIFEEASPRLGSSGLGCVVAEMKVRKIVTANSRRLLTFSKSLVSRSLAHDTVMPG